MTPAAITETLAFGIRTVGRWFRRPGTILLSTLTITAWLVWCSRFESHPLTIPVPDAGGAQGPKWYSPGTGVPDETYIVVDTANNRLTLRRGDRVLLEAVCSTGSGVRLRDGDSGRSWEFRTPRGRFQVRKKLENPLWVKPDWAFVEERKPVPADRSDRFEAGMLGAYALDFGNGYLIHGTLYERLLGRSVTHGCIRLGDRDLEQLFQAARVGTPVLIY